MGPITGIRRRAIAAVLVGLIVSGCSGGLNPFSRSPPPTDERTAAQRRNIEANRIEAERTNLGSSVFDLFEKRDDPNTTVEVNKYIWRASLEVLNFLPVEAVDPFSGVILTGYGTPPGGGRAYRATVLVQDPALDARSLDVALSTREGAVDAATQRRVEDAILTRARQLRLAEAGL